MRRPKLVASAHEHPAVRAYAATGRYPVKGTTPFSWDVWVHPRRDRTPEAEAERALAFIRSLTHSAGPMAGEPFQVAEWEERIVRDVFGTLDDEGFRRYRMALIFVPVRSGKTEFCAACMVYLLMGDQEKAAQLFSVAVDADQAALVYNCALAMIRNDPDLAARLEVIPSRKRILHHPSGSAWRVIASDAPSALGVNASAICMDELAQWPRREIYDVMLSRTGSRRAPLTLVATTAGSDPHGPGMELYTYAKRVQGGDVKDSSLYSVIYEPPVAADIFDEATWFACNPALAAGYRSLEEFRTAARQAQEIPGRRTSFEVLYLNVWKTGPASRWISEETWDACAGRVDLADLAGQSVILGVDLAESHDLCAVVLLAGDEDAGYVIHPWYFVASETLEERARRDRVPYAQWAADGLIRTIPGPVVDFEHVRAFIEELCEQYDVREVCIDRWRARQLLARLAERGLPAVEVPPTAVNICPAASEFERLLLAGQLRHPDHPVLNWNLSNTVVDVDAAGNARPTKARSTGRIDGIAATLLALVRALALGQQGSVYNHRGPYVLEAM